MAFRISLGAALLASSLTGCMVDGDEPMVEVVADSGMRMRDAGMVIERDDAGMAIKPMLDIAALQPATVYPTVPVSGTGPEGGRLLVRTPKGSVTAEISNSGAFCIDIPLEAEMDNELTFQAIDANGTYSEEVTVSIRQQGTPEQPPAPVGEEERNIGVGATFLAGTVSVEHNDWWAVSDDNQDSYVSLSNAYFDDDWFSMRLPERANIGSIRVTSNSTCVLEEYYVMVSDKDPPGPALASNSEDWKVVLHVKDGEGDDSYYVEPTIGRFIGIEFVSTDCSDEWTGVGNHTIREIEVWNHPLETPPPPSPEVPTCRSGGAPPTH